MINIFHYPDSVLNLTAGHEILLTGHSEHVPGTLELIQLSIERKEEQSKHTKILGSYLLTLFERPKSIFSLQLG